MDALTKDEAAAEAKNLLANPLLQEVLAKMESDAVASIKVGDTLTQAAACATLRVVDKFRAYLEAVITDDKVAKHIGRKMI